MIVKTSNLTKHYGKASTALSDVSVSIPENSITGLIGRNGSGKTTLMKILAGRLNKTDGEALVFGQAPMDNIEVLNKLIYSYHNIPYEPSWKLKKIIKAYQTMFLNFDKQFADKLMNYFDLSEKMKYKNLSQGMTSVFNFLCALSCRAELTMLDEPVLGMDVTVRKSVYEILLRDFTEHPRTFIISSHLLSELEGLLSDILLIERGKVILNNPVDDVQQSAYRVDGTQAVIEVYTANKKVITQRTNELGSFAIIHERCTEEALESARKLSLTVSAVRLEDLCVFLTQQKKEDDLECLW